MSITYVHLHHGLLTNHGNHALSPELVCALSVYRLLTLSRFSLVLRMDGVWDTAMMMKMLSRVLRKRWGTRSTGLTRTWNELWSHSFKCNKPLLLLSWLQIFSVICFSGPHLQLIWCLTLFSGCIPYAECEGNGTNKLLQVYVSVTNGLCFGPIAVSGLI